MELEGITPEKLAEVLLDDANGKMAREAKANLEIKIEEYNDSINAHRKKIERSQLRLNAAKTDKENPKILQDSIESFRTRLQKAKQEIEYCEKQIEILEARLPSEYREKQVKQIESEIKSYERMVNDLIQQKGVYVRFKNLIEESQKLRRPKETK